uniref:Cyclin N-terminal domain-containing protein n=1 Tax=Chromera velia CCMP2878 TaxID=1169474 RepID=A0A0G4HMW8_9ALVE|eukprot:Cvel_29297.t1-p1 / transcript=Cvel_29297.t1 / gene=Cvel_29297 / organism=Chromera_velia_CCMP2878 / gene_product=CDK5 and ABL1 enzyme substrate 1, putative / transcript_product=CDK5 and ABL1 enzyme substrate 1, putative / location=Cvel_scaffold3982:4398-8563(-) / protein_length=927 / sequence_SO=supercontig / SO=protein_coding / is_pseudo=false
MIESQENLNRRSAGHAKTEQPAKAKVTAQQAAPPTPTHLQVPPPLQSAFLNTYSSNASPSRVLREREWSAERERGRERGTNLAVPPSPLPMTSGASHAEGTLLSGTSPLHSPVSMFSRNTQAQTPTGAGDTVAGRGQRDGERGEFEKPEAEWKGDGGGLQQQQQQPPPPAVGPPGDGDGWGIDLGLALGFLTAVPTEIVKRQKGERGSGGVSGSLGDEGAERRQGGGAAGKSKERRRSGGCASADAADPDGDVGAEKERIHLSKVAVENRATPLDASDSPSLLLRAGVLHGRIFLTAGKASRYVCTTIPFSAGRGESVAGSSDEEEEDEYGGGRGVNEGRGRSGSLGGTRRGSVGRGRGRGGWRAEWGSTGRGCGGWFRKLIVQACGGPCGFAELGGAGGVRERSKQKLQGGEGTRRSTTGGGERGGGSPTAAGLGGGAKAASHSHSAISGGTLAHGGLGAGGEDAAAGRDWDSAEADGGANGLSPEGGNRGPRGTGVGVSGNSPRGGGGKMSSGMVHRIGGEFLLLGSGGQRGGRGGLSSNVAVGIPSYFNVRTRRTETAQHMRGGAGGKERRGVSYSDLLGPSEYKYDPYYLDDPTLKQGRHQSLMRFSSYHISILPFVKPRRLKEELNDRFRQTHPWLDRSITLSKLRNLKSDVFAVVDVFPDKIDACTAACAWVYFERLVLKKCVTKTNRKLLAGACLFLSYKFNQAPKDFPFALQHISEALQSQDVTEDLSPSDLAAAEFRVYALLDFSLQLDRWDVTPHILSYLESKDSSFEQYYGMTEEQFDQTTAQASNPLSLPQASQQAPPAPTPNQGAAAPGSSTAGGPGPGSSAGALPAEPSTATVLPQLASASFTAPPNSASNAAATGSATASAAGGAGGNNRMLQVIAHVCEGWGVEPAPHHGPHAMGLHVHGTSAVGQPGKIT